MARGKHYEKINVALGKCLKKARIDRDWSLEDVRSHMRQPKAKSTLKRYEDGEVDIGASVFEDLCDALGIDMHYLFENIGLDGELKDPDVLYVRLPGSMTNSEKRKRIGTAREMLSDDFYLNYLSMSDTHQQMIQELVRMYADQDSKN